MTPHKRNAAPGGQPKGGAKNSVLRKNLTAIIRQRATGKWPEILRALGMDPAALANRGTSCPGCGGNDRFRFDDRDGRGTWICSQGTGDTIAGDGFDLLRHVYGWTFGEAVEQVARVLGLSNSESAESRITDKQRLQWQEDAIRRQQAADAERLERDQRCANDAATLWAHGEPARAHAYLQRKGVQAHGIRQRCRLLLVPMLDAEGALWNVQKINSAGDKRFMPGRKKGLFHLIGTPGETLALAEGYATAATVHESTGWPVAVAFDAGNLAPVAEALARVYPYARFVVCADHDPAGLKGARAAAQAVGGYVIAPHAEGHDWNDAGPSAVHDAARQLSETGAAA